MDHAKQTRKWKKWKLSKYRFPTYIVKGSKPGDGALIVGRLKARDYLKGVLGHVRVEAMVESDTKKEWVFMEPISQEIVTAI